MNYKKTKNGFLISVKDWDKNITVKNLKTGEVITQTFTDHLTAVCLAKKL